MAERETETKRKAGTERVELRATVDEARSIANLLRYAVSLNTTAGLVSPTVRRLTTPTYRAVELAALVLEGKTFEEALREAETAWTGCLEEDHQHALELMQSTQETLQNTMAELTSPERFAEYLEISQEQFLQLIKSGMLKPAKIPEE